MQNSCSSAVFSVQGVSVLRYQRDRFYAEYHRAHQQTGKPLHGKMPSMFSWNILLCFHNKMIGLVNVLQQNAILCGFLF